ncbi:MAG TPA: OST-HTH/LOTUS domain-containing protein [Aggregatilinea sp.]|uniref:OST-HTH/LOTUS domain-containing protein n=1 Tax=Aggregatilinea sp. TaxID=2806333 RepID=UPI002CC21646|nr:OST-HTH/LOTUS domain-containing protein [Aggregatilinea sp.]HML20990.1 OST-HTH/LOTUS domain-containing protein [Aggregatilinea sp.]
MDEQKNEHDDDVLIDTICAGCDLPFPVNDLGLCDDCFAKLERDLIRARDWDYSTTAFITPPDQLEALRERIIRDYGADYELIASPETAKKPKRKNKRSHSRATQRKREIAAQAVKDYSTEDVLQAARNFIRERDEEWVNISRVMQHLYETFYRLKPKHLGQPGKKYKSLLKFLEDYPSDFELREDADKRGLYWIRLI